MARKHIFINNEVVGTTTLHTTLQTKQAKNHQGRIAYGIWIIQEKKKELRTSKQYRIAG